MMTSRTTALAVCLAVGLGTAADSAMALSWFDRIKNKNKPVSTKVESSYDHPSNKGFPNGRPWQATEHEFEELEEALEEIDDKVDEVKDDTEEIIDKVDNIQTDLDSFGDGVGDIGEDVGEIKDSVADIAGDVNDIEGDVDMLKNTLSVEVGVGPATDPGVTTLYVQVAQNGVGVKGLAADDFSYGNSFPADGAKFCGETCFAEGIGGVYMIDLLVDSGPGPYAGALGVSMEVVDDGNGLDVANGTALVTFQIEAIPAP